MKTLLENKIFIRMLLCGVISSLAVLSGCATVKQVSVTTPIKIKGKKEILVAEDIGRGSGVSRVFWCGNDALVAYSDKTGMELIEVQGGKRIEVSRNGQDYPFNCSPDGRWVLYMDRASTRLDKGEAMPLVYDGKPFEFDPKLDVWPVWEGYVADLYRYEVATGKRQRFAVVRSDLPAWEVVSPDGLKAFLGSRHNSSIEMPEPQWEPLWFTREDWDWNQTGALWFKDSSGVVSYGHNPNRLFVEFFGEDGWTKRFVLGPEYKDNIGRLTVDQENRIYFLVSVDYVPQPWSHFLLYRCAIKGRELHCEILHEIDRYIDSYLVLPDGDIIFDDHQGHCLYRITPGRSNDECIVSRQFDDNIYYDTSLDGISPDGRWLAIDRTIVKRTSRGEFSHYQYDLLVIELN